MNYFNIPKLNRKLETENGKKKSLASFMNVQEQLSHGVLRNTVTVF